MLATLTCCSDWVVGRSACRRGSCKPSRPDYKSDPGMGALYRHGVLCKVSLNGRLGALSSADPRSCISDLSDKRKPRGRRLLEVFVAETTSGFHQQACYLERPVSRVGMDDSFPGTGDIEIEIVGATQNGTRDAPLDDDAHNGEVEVVVEMCDPEDERLPGTRTPASIEWKNRNSFVFNVRREGQGEGRRRKDTLPGRASILSAAQNAISVKTADPDEQVQVRIWAGQIYVTNHVNLRVGDAGLC
jgi:hypothetical protein